jgi:Fanconi anemia group M protein
MFDSIPDDFIDNLDLTETDKFEDNPLKFTTAMELYKQEHSEPQQDNSIENVNIEQNTGNTLKLANIAENSKPQQSNTNGKNASDKDDNRSQISWDSLPDELFEETLLDDKSAKPSNTEKPVEDNDLIWEDIPEEIEKDLDSTFLVEDNNEPSTSYNALPQANNSASTSFNNTNFENSPQFVQQRLSTSTILTHNPPTNENLVHEADPSTINSWIYPTNYPVRVYQKNIVQTCLFNNTLVCLPTGLGKTFIAAVVMYNHLRWFPNSKVLFMAPTKPLVNQQMYACYDIMGIESSLNAELNGTQNSETRRLAWQQFSVFYATPQVVKNDIDNGICPWEQISCIVVDEAHRATGEFAYTTVVKRLTEVNHQFRVLALSATPGRDLSRVQLVVDNLNISKIEIRTEESLDVRQYTFTKQIETQMVSLTPNIERLLIPFQTLLGYFTGKLITKKVVFARDTTQAHTISSYALIKAREVYRGRNLDRSAAIPVEGEFAIAISFARSINLLITQGIKCFSESVNSWRKVNMLPNAGHTIARYKQELICLPEYARAFDTLDEVLGQDSLISHPKLEKMKSQIRSHFEKSKDQNTRVIIFAQFRDTVDEILDELQTLGPDIRATRFIGQANRKTDKGLKQSDQLKTLAHFKQGIFNILVSTSIGEEGLDIGEVDLIICYDCNSSPIRFLQRNGRTGRKRKGKVIMLLTQGRESMSLGTSKSSHKGVVKMIQSRSSNIKYSTFNPRLLPLSCHPMCEERQMEIKACDPSEFHTGRKRKRNTNDEDRCELGQGVGYLTFSETHQFRQLFRIEPNIFSTKSAIRNVLGTEKINLANYTLGQTRLTPVSTVLHGNRSRLLARTMMHIQRLIPNREDSPELPSIILDRPPEIDIGASAIQSEDPQLTTVSLMYDKRSQPKTPQVLDSLENNSIKTEDSNTPNFSSLESTTQKSSISTSHTAKLNNQKAPEVSGLSSLARFINPNCEDLPLCLKSMNDSSANGSINSSPKTAQAPPPKLQKLDRRKNVESEFLDLTDDFVEDDSASALGVGDNRSHFKLPQSFEDSYLSSDEDSLPANKAEYSTKLDDIFVEIGNVLSQDL